MMLQIFITMWSSVHSIWFSVIKFDVLAKHNKFLLQVFMAHKFFTYRNITKPQFAESILWLSAYLRIRAAVHAKS